MTASPSFLGLPNRLADGRLPRAVIFAAGHGSTYPGKDSSGYVLAADAIRAVSQDDAALVEHWDFDLGGPLFDGKPVCCIDAGVVETTMHDNAGNRARIAVKTREILSMPATPILLGGDCSVTIPFLAGFADHEPVWILQVDAHIDWRDEVHGERFGYSSPMRRASEMPHVASMVQVGLRSVGSARLADIEAARGYGSRFVTAREIHAEGAEAALRHIPQGARVVVTLDCDSLDPSIMPGVAARTPGGLTYTEVIDLIAGLGRRARIAGFDLVELYPPADIDRLSALTAARLLVNVVGAIARQV
ncbi:agmatinase [Rhizobium leguminosarum bv. viciae]|uniref:Agmatinase n=1 Tax=Rhizobium leguminosarum bv. viciae TaxID=387 RepID=A0A8I2GQ28_RHILV|nr:agmatinase [Rhizobium leguminosarum]MBY5751069.1 agmatinase [Rhizobium leguminosarum]MBY5794634.1 agmatinase [Rhizobium leguminosarum]NKM44545.1 agmatinase [Rhizobium leguminosarum bv. viciae]TBY73284.1 agmatinase [Rhizobium leguminosarum bv. viciae]